MQKPEHFMYYPFSLNFKDPEYEKAYKDYSKIYTLKMLNLFFFYIFTALIIALIKNFYISRGFFVLRTIILGIFLFLILLIIKKYGLKSKKNVEIGFCCLIIFIYAIHMFFFFPILFQTYGTEYLFYLGSSLESLRVFLFISEIRWYFVWTANMIINVMIFQNTIYLQDYSDRTNVFPLIFPIIMVNTMPLLAYFKEKNFRAFFFQNLNFDRTLKSFEVLINKILPNQVIILNDSKNKILFCNEEVMKFYSSIDYDFIYNKINEISLLDEMNKSLISSLNHRSFHEGHFISFQTSILGKQDEKFYFDIKIGKIHWQNEESFLILMSDITAIKLVRKLQELDAYKDRLLATVSHDLRTPLNGLNGILELLSSRLFEKEIQKYLKIATRCSSLLLFMINDILDFSQITNAKLRLNFSKYEISQLVKEVSNMLKFQFKRKNIKFIIEIQPELKSQFLFCDYRRVQQVLLNLLSNALKFTNEGYIKMTIQKKNTGNYKKFVEFIVEDTGVGIKKEDIPKLFTLFGKLELENPSINKSGIGLGLVISKHLVELLSNDQSATIHVKSDHGRGSTFSFDLPFDIPEEEDINDEFLEKEYKVNENYKEYKKKVNSPNLKNVDSSSSIQSLTNMSNIPYGSPSNPKILVVDDDQIGLFVISKYLKVLV